MGSLRNWATPLTIGSFLLLAVTGILMFFHIETSFNKLAHEWLSWVLVAGVLAHLAANLPSFKFHLRSTKGRVVIGAFVLILAASFLSFGNGSKGGSPVKMALDHLTDAPIATLALVAKTDADTLVSKMKAQGFTSADAQKSLHDVAGGNPQKEKALLRLTFAAE